MGQSTHLVGLWTPSWGGVVNLSERVEDSFGGVVDSFGGVVDPFCRGSKLRLGNADVESNPIQTHRTVLDFHRNRPNSTAFGATISRSVGVPMK